MNNVFLANPRFLLLVLCALLVSSCGTTPQQTPTQEQTRTAPTLPTQSGTLSASQKVEFQHAITEIGKENYKKSIKTLTRLDKKGSYYPVKLNLALVYYKTENFDKAEASLQQALSLNNKDAKLYNLEGLLKLEKHEFKAAEKAFAQAVALNKDYALAYYNLALLYDIYYQNIQQAYKYYLTYLNLIDYKDEQTLNWVEQLKYSLGDG